jgi:hypothetical protein
MPANARATYSDKTDANAMPNAAATKPGKPSDLMALSPQLGPGSTVTVTKPSIDFGGIVI